MSIEQALVEGAVTTGIIGGIAKWAFNKQDKRIDAVEKQASKIELDLAGHRLDSEKRYAKEETLQSSFARVHERLDKIIDIMMNKK